MIRRKRTAPRRTCKGDEPGNALDRSGNRVSGKQNSLQTVTLVTVGYIDDPNYYTRTDENGNNFLQKTKALPFANKSHGDIMKSAGRMMMQMISSFAEFERAMLRERTWASLESARDEGRIGGSRSKLLLQQQAEVVKMVTHGKENCCGCRSTVQCSSRDDLPAACADRR